MAAVITRPAILQAFSEKTEYFNTFGGNPVAAAVGLAVLEVIEQEALMNNAQRNGDYLRAGLRQLAQISRPSPTFAAPDCSTPSSLPGQTAESRIRS